MHATSLSSALALFVAVLLVLMPSPSLGATPVCPVNGNGPGNYSCQQAIVPYTLPNDTVIYEPQLLACKNNTAYLCAQGSPFFATGW